METAGNIQFGAAKHVSVQEFVGSDLGGRRVDFIAGDSVAVDLNANGKTVTVLLHPSGAMTITRNGSTVYEDAA